MKLTRLITVVSILALSLGTSAFASGFVKYEGFDGESKDPNHLGWTNILYITHSLAGLPTGQPSAGQSVKWNCSGKLTGGVFTIVKRLDKASPRLAKGTAVSTVEIHIMRGRSPAYFRYQLTNVQVTSCDVSGTTERVKLRFRKGIYTYLNPPVMHQ